MGLRNLQYHLEANLRHMIPYLYELRIWGTLAILEAAEVEPEQGSWAQATRPHLSAGAHRAKERDLRLLGALSLRPRPLWTLDVHA